MIGLECRDVNIGEGTTGSPGRGQTSLKTTSVALSEALRVNPRLEANSPKTAQKGRDGCGS